MIRDSNGEPTTARRLAQEKVMSALATAAASVYDPRAAAYDGMTERERAEVLRFIEKEADRCARLLGFDGVEQV